jgi:hypothetical protein
MNGNSYGDKGTLKDRAARQGQTRRRARTAAEGVRLCREAKASQPLTSGLWLGGHKADPAKLIPIEKVQLEQSDVISFHSYDPLEGTKTGSHVSRSTSARSSAPSTWPARRAARSTRCWPTSSEQKIAAYNWGFVPARATRFYPWDSWQKPYAAEPPVWFHDIFRPDGTPYREKR